MKGYRLENYKEFCKEAFIYPPFEEGVDMKEWFDEHKIHITVNGCDMELEYDADAISILECALKELYGANFYEENVNND